jgi:hypothetical protein
MMLPVCWKRSFQEGAFGPTMWLVEAFDLRGAFGGFGFALEEDDALVLEVTADCLAFFLLVPFFMLQVASTGSVTYNCTRREDTKVKKRERKCKGVRGVLTCQVQIHQCVKMKCRGNVGKGSSVERAVEALQHTVLS